MAMKLVTESRKAEGRQLSRSHEAYCGVSGGALGPVCEVSFDLGLFGLDSGRTVNQATTINAAYNM